MKEISSKLVWGGILVLAAMCFLLGSGTGEIAFAREIDGISFPDEVTVGQSPCKLIGVGLRKKLFVNVYYGALYLSQPTKAPEQVISTDQPKRVVLHVVYKEVEPAKWVEGWQEGFAKTASNADAAMQQKIDQFLKCFKEPVKKGEEVSFSYTPGTGTEVVIKGKPLATIAGADFMKILWSIWFGKQPASESLMNGMLGK